MLGLEELLQVSVLFSVPNILVFHLNISLLTTNTPLAKMFRDGRVEESCCKTIHYSDILRLAVLYRWIYSARTFINHYSTILYDIIRASMHFFKFMFLMQNIITRFNKITVE